MESSFKEGDHVVYFPTGAESNTSSGVIKKIVHERGGPQAVKASEEMPRYVIENDKTHKETAYKLENIIETVQEGGYGEEIEETEAEMENTYEETETKAEEEEHEEEESEHEKEYDEKEYIREATDIGAWQ